jgi:hypothetical protein
MAAFLKLTNYKNFRSILRINVWIFISKNILMELFRSKVKKKYQIKKLQLFMLNLISAVEVLASEEVLFKASV